MAQLGDGSKPFADFVGKMFAQQTRLCLVKLIVQPIYQPMSFTVAAEMRHA